MSKKTKFNIGLFVVFIALSIIDILFNAGAIIVPAFGSLTKALQESINEGIQIFIVTYFFMLSKK